MKPLVPQGVISGDMHQQLIELSVLAGDLPPEKQERARRALGGLFDAVDRVNGLECMADIQPHATRGVNSAVNVIIN